MASLATLFSTGMKTAFSLASKYRGQAWTIGKSPTLQSNGMDPWSSLKFRAR